MCILIIIANAYKNIQTIIKLPVLAAFITASEVFSNKLLKMHNKIGKVADHLVQ